MFDLKATQEALGEFGLDAWLLYDFRSSNMLARRILDIADNAHTSRRYYYLIPRRRATPIKLVHRIEPGTLDHLPGSKRIYLRWQELEEEIGGLSHGLKRVAMEYSPRNANPYVARVDAGTIEVVKAHRRGGRLLGRPDPAIRGAPGTTTNGRCTWRPTGSHRSAYDLAWGFVAEQDPRRRHDPARWRSRRRSWTISGHMD